MAEIVHCLSNQLTILKTLEINVATEEYTSFFCICVINQDKNTKVVW